MLEQSALTTRCCGTIHTVEGPSEMREVQPDVPYQSKSTFYSQELWTSLHSIPVGLTTRMTSDSPLRPFRLCFSTRFEGGGSASIRQRTITIGNICKTLMMLQPLLHSHPKWV